MIESFEKNGLHVRVQAGKRELGPKLLLLHGAGSDGEVWDEILSSLEEIAGTLVIPDLPGHGKSGPGSPYGIGNMAAHLSRLFAQDERIMVLGHSLGGAIAIAMATNLYGIVIDRVFAIDVKLKWTDEEVAKGQEQASRPSRVFDTKEAAVERYLKVSGLYGLIDAASSRALSGVVADEGGYKLRSDPKANVIAGTSVAAIASSITSPLHLLAGNRNPMMSEMEMRELDPDGTIIENCGHNVHVERPDLIAAWVKDRLTADRVVG